MGFYAGFDAAVFPGVDTMAWLKAHSNLSWCGYYLAPAPNLAPQAGSWRGQRAAIDASWGLAPIYVGQQLPRRGAPGDATPAFSSILTAAQGRADGEAAVALALRDGFVRGSYIYVDWEDGGALTQACRNYLGAWLSAVSARGFGPGAYCSHLLADQFARLLLAVRPRRPGRLWCFKVSSTALHELATPLTRLPANDPAGSGYADAVMWQYEQNAWFDRPITGQRIVADFNSASMADPGRPAAPAQPAGPAEEGASV